MIFILIFFKNRVFGLKPWFLATLTLGVGMSIIQYNRSRFEIFEVERNFLLPNQHQLCLVFNAHAYTRNIAH